MRRQEASRVVSSPLPETMAKLRVVEQWPVFLSNVTAVTRTAHARYTFHVHDGRVERDTPVAVSIDARKHVIRWKSISGATFAGCLALSEADPGHTTVRLELTQYPATMGAMASEMLAPGRAAALLDLDALDHFLTGPP